MFQPGLADPISESPSAEDVKRHLVAWHRSNEETFSAIGEALLSSTVQQSGFDAIKSISQDNDLKNKLKKINFFVGFLRRSSAVFPTAAKNILGADDFVPIDDGF